MCFPESYSFYAFVEGHTKAGAAFCNRLLHVVIPTSAVLAVQEETLASKGYRAKYDKAKARKVLKAEIVALAKEAAIGAFERHAQATPHFILEFYEGGAPAVEPIETLENGIEIRIRQR